MFLLILQRSLTAQMLSTAMEEPDQQFSINTYRYTQSTNICTVQLITDQFLAT